MKEENISLSRIQWRCRRGMLELDALLSRFLEKYYQTLTNQQVRVLLLLLDCEDNDLYRWLIRHEQPTDSKFLEIVSLIRKA